MRNIEGIKNEAESGASEQYRPVYETVAEMWDDVAEKFRKIRAERNMDIENLPREQFDAKYGAEADDIRSNPEKHNELDETEIRKAKQQADAARSQRFGTRSGKMAA